MKKFAVPVATAAAGLAVGLLFGSGVLHAQQTPAPAPSMAPPISKVAPIGGTIQVERLTDTTFVVVKDVGDEAVVTLFSTQDGIVQKKHSGRFFY